MATYKALDIARWFIARNQSAVDTQGADKLTLLKLLKLLYYAEGCSLALNRGSLFSEKIVAWEHGPVVVEVYNHYCGDAFNLPFGTTEDKASFEMISQNTDDCTLLEDVFSVFGKYSAWGLREMTHKEKPWLEATNGGKNLKGEISRDTMRQYFKEHYVED